MLLAIWTPLRTKLSTAGCLTTSEFVCTIKQRGRPREKLVKAYSYHTHVQFCSHAQLIMWSVVTIWLLIAYSVKKLQQLSCRSYTAVPRLAMCACTGKQLLLHKFSPRHQHLWCYFYRVSFCACTCIHG